MPASEQIFQVFIENQAGSSIKNTYDEKTLKHLGGTKVSRPYPYPYGFALDTVSGDGDAVDCFVVTQDTLQSSDIVECIPVHLLEQVEDGEVDHKVLCVPTGAESVVDGDAVDAIRAFIMSVFAHVPGKKMQLGSLLDTTEAKRYIRECRV